MAPHAARSRQRSMSDPLSPAVPVIGRYNRHTANWRATVEHGVHRAIVGTSFFVCQNPTQGGSQRKCVGLSPRLEAWTVMNRSATRSVMMRRFMRTHVLAVTFPNAVVVAAYYKFLVVLGRTM
jgi:hypothetical protein